MMNIEEPNSQFLDNTPKIRVVIRKRPLSKKESQRNDADIVDIRGIQTAVVRESKTKVDLTKYIEEHAFNFDRAFEETATNQQIYFETMRPLVESLFNKAKVTCFAYGQTGSGKTYTMMGDSGSDNPNNMTPGLYLLAAQDIFALLEQPTYQHLSLYLSFYEIYCSKLHDLLNDRQQLFAREDAKQNVNIVGLSEKKVSNVQSLMQIIDFGNSVRTTASTSANLDSSRSHAILQITLKAGNKMHGKMSFIDLAGSERGADVTDTNKQTRMDGAEINKSLLALKECIRALDQDKKHTPFRGSKLTLVLKDSFTGNCKTLMIGNISPSSNACEHTLNTLRYADRVKELKKPAGESGPPLSQMDLLAQQLMLPRQNKNSTKFNIKKEEDTANEDVEEFLLNKGKGITNFKQLPNGNQIQQPNKVPGQLLFNQQRQMTFPNSTPNYANTQTQEDLFNIPTEPEVRNGAKFMKDVVNTPNKSQMLNNFISKQPNPTYQPSLYQNNFGQFNNLNQQAQAQRSTNGKENIIELENNMIQLSHNGYHVNAYNPNAYNAGAPVYSQPRDYLDFKAKNEGDLMMLSQRHQQLINLILSEEEEVITIHRQHIDDMVDCVKQEMGLLSEVEKPASDIDEYVDSLDTILQQKVEMINILRTKLHRFRANLREEEFLSKKFNEQKNEMMDIFDLNTEEPNKNDEFQLLDDLHHVMS